MKTLLLLSLLLSGCGKSDNASSAWAESDQNTFMTGCLSTATTKAPADIASNYCKCVLDATMAKFSAAEFNENPALDASEIFNDGSVARCKTQAGVI